MDTSSSTFFISLAFAFLFPFVALSQNNTKCPFQYVYHFGDGVTDIGNSIRILPYGPSLPAASLPYGRSFPGFPTGRWSDGLADFDYAAADLGIPNIAPYLSRKASSSNGVIFSVARSPVLNRNFFISRGVTNIPPYTVSLNAQFKWFRSYLKSVCSSGSDCAKRLANSLILFGDIEANDVGYSLIQGKSIDEIETYVPFITQAHINIIKELIKMGARLIIVPGSAPIGCYPYLLTKFPSNDPNAYDSQGCLKNINDLIAFKNSNLQQALNNLQTEFPDVIILYVEYGQGTRQYLAETLAGSNRNNTLKTCCGIGGRYNYDSRRFCGSRGVPVCRDPYNYVFWDGLHLTQEASLRIEKILVAPVFSELNCTSSLILDA